MRVTHDELIERGKRWLLGTGRCNTVVAGAGAWFGEAPDAIGWMPSGVSILIECKTTLSDYYSDLQKPCRRVPENGIGAFRFYMAEKGLLTTRNLRNGWGLLEVGVSQVRRMVNADLQTYSLRAELKLLIAAHRNRHIFMKGEDEPYCKMCGGTGRLMETGPPCPDCCEPNPKSGTVKDGGK